MLLFVLSSQVGWAAGFYTTTSGAKALGRGGAYVAGVDDLSAQFHNPAGLVRLEAPQIMLDISWVEATASFQRAPLVVPTKAGDQTAEFDEAKEEGAPFPIPSLGFGTHLGLEDWTFAIGFYPHYAPHQEWPEDGAQRYSLVTSTEWQAYGGPTVAHRFADWLSIGIGLQWTFLRADREFYLSSCDQTLGCNPADTSVNRDVKSTVTSLDAFQPSANLGVLVEPSERLSLGFFVQPPIDYRAKAKITTHIPEENPLASQVVGNDFHDDDVTLLVTFPLILKLGANLAVSDRVELELDAGYQGWSANQDIVLTDLDLVIPLQKGIVFPEGGDAVIDDDVAIKSNYVDSYSVHLGGEWDVSDKLDLRAGTFYETTAIPTDWFNVTELDANKLGVGLGATWKPSEHFAIDVALARNQMLLGEVTDSQSAAVTLHLPPDDIDAASVLDGVLVGNGTYKMATTIGSLGATYFF